MKQNIIKFTNKKNLAIIGVCLLIALVLGYGYLQLSARVNEGKDERVRLQEEIDNIKEFVGFVDMDDKEAVAKAALSFLESDEVKMRMLDKDSKLNDVLNMAEKEYYVLFYMKDCPHCQQVEALLSQSGLPNNLYFYSTDNIDTSDTDIKWGGESDEEVYEINEEDFKLVGAPTLLKVMDGRAIAYIGTEAISSELGL